MLGASAAALVSAGLVYWISSGGDSTLKPLGHAPVAAPASASPEADPGQVVRAYEQLQEVYADRGASGVAGFARGCARSLAADPGALDFCVAFDIYAGSLIGDDEIARAWRANADERELALVRAALPPTGDPYARLAQIRRLARQISLHTPDQGSRPTNARPSPHRAKVHHAKPAKPALEPVREVAAAPVAEPAARGSDQPPEPAAQPVESPPAAAATVQAKPRAKPAAVKKASVRRARPAPGKTDACRRKPTPGERTVCASPSLRQADAQLQAAYRKAVAAGADAGQLAREQARFRRSVNVAAPDRVAVERLYYQRTRKLEALSQAP